MLRDRTATPPLPRFSLLSLRIIIILYVHHHQHPPVCPRFPIGKSKVCSPDANRNSSSQALVSHMCLPEIHDSLPTVDSSKTMWFGRDAFGRRSLLVHWPSLKDSLLLPSSVSPPSSIHESPGPN